MVARKLLEPSRALVLVLVVFFVQVRDDDSAAGACVDKPVAAEVDSHVADFPETSEKDEVGFAQVPTADGLAAFVLVHHVGVVGEGNIEIALVDLQDIAGAVGLRGGTCSVDIGGAEPFACVCLETRLFGGRLRNGFFRCCLLDFACGCLVAFAFLDRFLGWPLCLLGRCLSDGLVIANVPVVSRSRRERAAEQAQECARYG